LSPNSTTEYFVVEYRKKEGTFENILPGEGLLVYRINTSKTGNAFGPPDEVYIYRPDGTLSEDGFRRLANFSADVGRTAINDITNPSSFLSDGGPGGLVISNIGAIGSTINFFVHVIPQFTEQTTNLPGVWKSSVDWGDYDNDGDLDLLITGLEWIGNGTSKIYKNNEDHSFTPTSIFLTPVYESAVAFGDYDN